MIHFITGKPGGGKTLYGVRLMIDELIKGDRVVVTNLPLKMGELNEYLQKEYPNDPVDIFKRIRVISDDQCKKFFLYRGYDLQGVEVDIVDPGDKNAKLDYSAGGVFGSVFYVIDEIHLFFNAREFANTGKQCLWYVSQHRKLGDDLVCVTQFVGNVDRQFRVLAQDFTSMRNLSNERFGMFQLPGVFTRRTYQEIPTSSSVANETATFRLDVKGIASCYNTAAGVGILGRGDMKRRRKGIKWYWMIVAAVALIITMAIIPRFLVTGISSLFVWSAGGGKKVMVANGGAGSNALPVAAPGPVAGGRDQLTNIDPSQAFAGGRPVGPVEGGSGPIPGAVEDILYITGYTQVGDKATMYLSNNTTVKTDKVKFIQGKWVYFKDGTRAKYDEAYNYGLSQSQNQRPDPANPYAFTMPRRQVR